MIHNSCNMVIHDLPDMYALGPAALDLQAYIHIRQIPHGHVTTITYSLVKNKETRICMLLRNFGHELW